MPAHSYWRLLIYGPKGQDVAITEWKFFDSGSTQIATTGGTPLSSSNNGGEGPANAFDGNTSTIWTPNPAPNFANPQWLRYQFPSAVTPATYSIQNRNASSPLWAPDSWSLQSSDDGTTWTTVGNYSAAWTTPLQTQTFTVGAYGLGDWYRLLITSVASGSNHCRIGQIVFKDASGTAISLVNGFSNASTCIVGADNGSADAFDGLPASGQWESNNNPTPGSPEWIGYRFFASAAVVSFDLYAGNDFLFNNAPLNFSLQKSTDGGTTWVTVGAYTAATWTQGAKQTFGVASISVSPATAAQGAATTLTITGTSTHFVSGTTTVSFSGTGITVGTITVASATSLTAAITISPTAATGAYTITVTTGSEAPTTGFTLTAGVFQRGNIDYDQVRTAARQGAGSKFQMFAGGTITAGHAAVYDVNGNVTDGGAAAGTVTSIALTMPTEFAVAGSPVTSNGTFAITKNNEAANTFWGAPNGAAGVPVFRPLVMADLPSAVGTGTVTSVGLSLPAEFTVTGSPVTTSGTLTVTTANETANTVWAGPSSGGSAAPAFRALAAADLPAASSISVNGTLVANVVNAPLLVNGIAIP
jgi:hypothetical protein